MVLDLLENLKSYEALNPHFSKVVDFIEKNIVQSLKVDSVDLKISDYHGFLLSLHGINAEEIKLSPSIATMYYSDYIAGDLERIRIAVKEPNTLNLRAADTFLEIFTHSKNSYYASILSELSNFPKKSLSTFNELNKLWIHFPKEFLMGGDRAYYEDIIIIFKSLIQNEKAVAEAVRSSAAEWIETY